MDLRDLGAALLQGAFAVRRQLSLHLVDEQRQRRLRVGRHGDVRLRQVLEVLKVALDEEIERRNVDRLRLFVALRGDEARTAASLNFEVQDHVGHCRSAVARERMPRREVHAIAAAVDRRLQELGELDEPGDALRSPRHAAGIDARILRADEQARRLAHGVRIADRKRRHRQPRDAHRRRGHRPFLHVVIEDNQDRLHRRRHRDLIGAHHRLGERRERRRLIVPLHAVAHDEPHVLSAVIRVHAVRARPGITKVAGDDEHGHAVGIGVVDRHRCVLQANVAVHDREHRLAFDLGVAVRHRDRRLFVAARQQLRHPVFAVVDDRFVQPFEARSRIRGDVLEAEALDHVDHEVRRGVLDDPEVLTRRGRRSIGKELSTIGRRRNRPALR
jgi:hypothetical protein